MTSPMPNDAQTITDEELARWEGVAKAATPGEWTLEKPPMGESGFRSGLTIAATYGGSKIYGNPPGGQFPVADARHIATFDPPTALRLIAELRKSRAERDECVAYRTANLAELARVTAQLTAAKVDLEKVQQVANNNHEHRTKDILAIAAQRDAAYALVDDIKRWASQRCPCENDEPGICPLCGADVDKDRCMAVDVSFPRALRARIEAMVKK